METIRGSVILHVNNRRFTTEYDERRTHDLRVLVMPDGEEIQWDAGLCWQSEHRWIEVDQNGQKIGPAMTDAQCRAVIMREEESAYKRPAFGLLGGIVSRFLGFQ